MGMIDFEYEEALKYRYEYWEREGWLSACIETIASIGGREANWDMLDTIGILVGRMDTTDRNRIADLRDASKGYSSKSRDEKGEYDSKMYYDGLYEIIKARLDYTREEIAAAEKVIEDYY